MVPEKVLLVSFSSVHISQQASFMFQNRCHLILANSFPPSFLDKVNYFYFLLFSYYILI